MAKPKNPENSRNSEVDPEMLKNLDLLMNMEVLENEAQWEDIESLDEIDDLPDEEFEDEA